MSTLPNLFLIGGMKCGSTTLYADLALHPGIHAPAVKEPTFLERSELSDDGVARLYEQLHAGGEGAHYRMDGSTRYSMREQIPDAAQRIRAICGEDCKIIYLVRDPVDRVVSHYRHAFASGALNWSLSEAIDRDPAILENTRYMSQLQPWLDAFGQESVFVGAFDAYVQDRLSFVNATLGFLGLTLLAPETEFGGARNVSAGRRNPPKIFSALTRTPFYKNHLAPRIPTEKLSSLKKVLYRKAPEARVELSPELEARIRLELAEEMEGVRSYVEKGKVES